MTASDTVATSPRTRPRHHVGHVGDFPPGEFRLVRVGSTEVGVILTSEGLAAMRNHCPHMGADICRGEVVGTMRDSAPDEFDYDPEHLAIQCPWHRWQWSLRDGAALGRVTNRRLRLYDVEVEGDDVYLTPRRPTSATR